MQCGLNILTQADKLNTENKHGMTGKQNAAKLSEDKAESFIHARCKSSDKAAWVKAAKAQNMKLTEWIVQKLNNAAKNK